MITGGCKRSMIPLLDKPPEEQEWDVSICYNNDSYGHSGDGSSWSTLFSTASRNSRWSEYDSVYEKMWKEMARNGRRSGAGRENAADGAVLV